MSSLLSLLTPALRGFFEAFFKDKTEASSLEALRDQVEADLEITVGRYRPYSGAASYVNGHRLLPRYAIHVERQLVYFAGTGRGLTFFNAPTPPDAPPVAPYQYSLLRIDERVDPLTDDRDAMVRLFAAIRPPAQTTGAAAVNHAAAAAWADAITAQKERDPAVFEVPLSELEQVPQGMPAADLAEYKRIMFEHATYIEGSGEYYPKRNQTVVGAFDQPIAFPEGTTPGYIAINMRELVLEPNKTYCLVNLPDGWGTGIDRQIGRFREIVFKLNPIAEGGYEYIPVSWATRLVEWGSAPARDSFDFCFFVTDQRSVPQTEPLPDEFDDSPT